MSIRIRAAGSVVALLLAAPSLVAAQATDSTSSAQASTSRRAEADAFTLRLPVPFVLSVATATQSKVNATGSGHTLRLAQGERSRALEASGQATSTSSGQAYPSKPLRIIIPFPPGGATDIAGRYVAQKLGESFGQQVIPDNRPGANGTIGLELTAKAPPDGHTLVLGQTGNLAISPGLTKVNYDPARDFAPITLVIASPHALAVHPSLPAHSLKDLIALARSKPAQLNYASTGSGSAGHLGMELLKKATRMDVLHVPYKGANQGLTDLVAGHVALMFTSVLSTAQFQKSGKVRVIAGGSLERSPSLPEVPTIAESG
ncbi:MAG TPA: tripartite tricarboxylate transporter substrate binding protein, partial [Burkholderiales bacterium]